MAYLPSHVPQLARCCGNGGRRSTEDDAARGRDHNDAYGKGIMDSKLEAHTKLLEYARVGFSGVADEPALESTLLTLMVGAEGFEPPTLCSQSRCATRLRYAPTAF